MNQEERQQKIDTILGEIKKQVDFPDIPVRMWIVAETGKPGEPDFVSVSAMLPLVPFVR